VAIASGRVGQAIIYRLLNEMDVFMTEMNGDWRDLWNGDARDTYLELFQHQLCTILEDSVAAYSDAFTFGLDPKSLSLLHSIRHRRAIHIHLVEMHLPLPTFLRQHRSSSPLNHDFLSIL